MSRCRKALLRPDTTLIDAVRVLDETALQICLIVDEDGRMQGSLTDGDIRRAMLSSKSLDTPVKNAMNSHPHTAGEHESRHELIAKMTRLKIYQIPILDESSRVVGVETLE